MLQVVCMLPCPPLRDVGHALLCVNPWLLLHNAALLGLCPPISLHACTQDKGIKCKVNIPDTVLFRFGQLSAWWGTNKVRAAHCATRHAAALAHTWNTTPSGTGHR